MVLHPPGLKPPPEDHLDTRNVVLKAIENWKAIDTPVHVADPRNKDPLDLDWDAARDAALKTMQDQRRKESCLSSAGSRV